LLGQDDRGISLALGALGVSAVASVVAGLTLAGAEQELERHAGLMVLVPAAIGVKGAIFGGLGSRLSTAIHTGVDTSSFRVDSVIGQNVIASVVLSLVMGVVLALLAALVAVVFGVEGDVSLENLIVVSSVGGVLASLVVLVITLGLAAGGVRWGWDLDDVTAPLVTATGDLVSLPFLIVVVGRLGSGGVNRAIAVAMTASAAIALIWAVMAGLPVLKRVLIESIPALVAAGMLSVVAGLVLEKRLDQFSRVDVLLILLPGFLGSAGALGGILSSRLSSKLHLGLITPDAMPDGEARADIGSVLTMAVPVFAFTAFVAHQAGLTAEAVSPGAPRLMLATVLAGVAATVLVSFIAYYGTIGAERLHLDPDTYGIPFVTASLDLVGASTLTLAAVGLGII